MDSTERRGASETKKTPCGKHAAPLADKRSAGCLHRQARLAAPPRAEEGHQAHARIGQHPFQLAKFLIAPHKGRHLRGQVVPGQRTSDDRG